MSQPVTPKFGLIEWTPTESIPAGAKCARCHTEDAGSFFKSDRDGLFAHAKCLKESLASTARSLQNRKLNRYAYDAWVYSLPTFDSTPDSPRSQSEEESDDGVSDSSRSRSSSESRAEGEADEQIEEKSDSFWAQHKGKIIVGAALVAGVAILGGAVLRASEENWHEYCLQSLDNAKEMWCCAKQVASDASTCLFKRFEPANFWTFSGDTEQLALEELPKHAAEPYIRDTWVVTSAQKLFKSIFG